MPPTHGRLLTSLTFIPRLADGGAGRSRQGWSTASFCSLTDLPYSTVHTVRTYSRYQGAVTTNQPLVLEVGSCKPTQSAAQPGPNRSSSTGSARLAGPPLVLHSDNSPTTRPPAFLLGQSKIFFFAEPSHLLTTSSSSSPFLFIAFASASFFLCLPMCRRSPASELRFACSPRPCPG